MQRLPCSMRESCRPRVCLSGHGHGYSSAVACDRVITAQRSPVRKLALLESILPLSSPLPHAAANSLALLIIQEQTSGGEQYGEMW